MSPVATTQGRVTAVTLLFPLRRRWVPYLRLLFRAAHVLPLTDWTLLRLKRIHYCRWALVSNLPPGERRSHRRELRPHMMLFESNFNGDFDGYIDAFSYAFPLGMRLIFGGAERYPGAQPTAGFKRWILDHQLELAHWYCAYPDHTTRAVLSALEVRKRMRDLLPGAAEATPEQFRKNYDALLAALQREI